MKNTGVGFRLIGMRTNFFQLSPEHFSGKDQFDVNYNACFGFNLEFNAIGSICQISYTENGVPFLELHLECFFEVSHDLMTRLISSDRNKLTLPKDLQTHFAVISVGAARGYIHSKTEESSMNRYFLPTLNLTEVITNDVTIDVVSQ